MRIESTEPPIRLATAISPADTTLSLDRPLLGWEVDWLLSGSATLRVEDESMRVLFVDSTRTLVQVTRGANRTTVRPHTPGS